ncbi:MAG: tRNA ((6))-methyltransferase TrmN6 [Labilithrix sp.]|nr:tRNA ((6))-methyltransferase TrmN6 [Labilithrix sp.]
MAEVKGVTQDTLFGGRVALAQPAKGGGYRVNVDAVLLGAFAAGALGESRRVRRAHAAFDLGAGVGGVGLSLLHLDAADHVTMIEVDPALAKLAEANARSNEWTERIAVVRADVTDAETIPAGVADLVVCNPPYVEPGRGRAPAPSRARARSGPLSAFLDAARRLAGRRARVCLVYPAIEATTLLTELRARGLEPKRLRAVHGRAQDNARVVLVECAAGRPGGLAVEPPLVETSPDAPLFLGNRKR